MAQIGMDKLYYATITKNETTGVEEYGDPEILAKAISAEMSVEVSEAILYADDGAVCSVKEFSKGTLSLNVLDIGSAQAAILTGATVDTNDVLISTTNDTPKPVAIGFRSKTLDNKYRYFWLYKVVFSVPNVSTKTKGAEIEFQTPTIEGTILRKDHPDSAGNYPWKADIVSETEPQNWFGKVYEPVYN